MRNAVVALVALGNLACATTRAQRAESWPDAITASQLLHEHWDAPAGSDAQFRRNIAAVGLMSRLFQVPGKGTALDLQTIERSYFVRCWLTSDAAVISTGQLVAVQGVGTGQNKNAPELSNCSVTWLGESPGARPDNPARDAAIAAASASLCAAEAMAQAISAAEASGPSEYFVRRRGDMAKLTQRKRDVLAKHGGVALACDHPLVVLVSRCSLPLGSMGSAVLASKRADAESLAARAANNECAVPQVQDAVEQLRADL